MVSALEERVHHVLRLQKELANLYELSAQFALTEVGEDQMMRLRQDLNHGQKELRDLDLLFEYVKKLLEANAEVNFLVEEDFSSRQISQRLHEAGVHVKERLEAVQLGELDLARAHAAHIEKSQKKSVSNGL